MASLTTVFLSSAGVLLAVGITGHHLYHVIRHDRETLHGSLSDYYRLMLPYVAVTGVVAAAFFGIYRFPAELTAVTGDRALVDVAFLGITLVWLGAAQQIFSAVDTLAEDYYSGGESGGG
ncbi:MAG: hypothetical protein SVY41_03440 [Candidatus Nanohaloarchaea archaeon]|nr:hypothetical protein [Candidatus Nanohaloarchaea archaeon]